MNTTLTTLTWLRPEWLWGILPIAFGLWLWPRNQAQRNPWENVCDPHLLAHLTKQQPYTAGARPKIIVAIVLLVLIIALAGPSWEFQQQPLYRKDAVVVVALDMSPAMMDEDLPPSRLHRAKYKLSDFFRAWQEGSVGLIAYTDEAFVASPLTTDTQTLQALLPALEYSIMPVRGSNVTHALQEAERLMQQSHTDHGDILVVTAAHIPDEAYPLARALLAKHIRTHVYALRADPQYQQLAQSGGGQLQQFTDDDKDLQQLSAYFASQNTAKTHQSEETLAVRLDQGHYFLWLLLPLLLLAFRRGWLEGLVP